MGKNSNIEWTDFTWNPWHGCKKVSDGCKNCYMFRDKKRYGQDPANVVRSADKTFYAPLKWPEPQKIFTCSWSDFFIEEADEWRDEAFAIMALTPQHTYQILTKRPDRMMAYLTNDHILHRIAYWMGEISGTSKDLQQMFERSREIVRFVRNFSLSNIHYQLPNVWLGVSVEDQKTADERIPLLLQTPAAVRFLSIEPLLGPVQFSSIPATTQRPSAFYDLTYFDGPGLFSPQGRRLADAKIDWFIVGGESGPNARPMHPDWVRSIRDQCQAAGVPFHFKQWGEWEEIPREMSALGMPRMVRIGDCVVTRDGRTAPILADWSCELEGEGLPMRKAGKKKAGRLLDGREWNEFPEAANVL